LSVRSFVLMFERLVELVVGSVRLKDRSTVFCVGVVWVSACLFILARGLSARSSCCWFYLNWWSC